MTRRRWIIALAAAALLAILGASQYWVLSGRVATVDAGRLYRSAALPPGTLIDVCRRLGVRTVIDLRKAPQDAGAEAAALAQAGIRHIHLPTGQVPTPDTVAQYLRIMDDARNAPALVHCTHGVGRSGVFSAIYRMEYQGWPAWRAITEAMILSGFGSFGPGNDKAKYLWSYTPRSAGRAR